MSKSENLFPKTSGRSTISGPPKSQKLFSTTSVKTNNNNSNSKNASKTTFATQSYLNPVGEYDYIIIGNGTSGAWTANNISLNAVPGNAPTLVLDMGQYKNGSSVEEIIPNLTLFSDQNYAFANPTVPQTITSDVTGGAFAQICPVFSSGKVLGGSSLYNDTVATRPPSSTLEDWVEFTGSDYWTDGTFLSNEEQIETFTGSTQDPGQRGSSGPLQIRQSDPSSNDLSTMVTTSMENITGDDIVLDYNVTSAELCISKYVQYMQYSPSSTMIRSNSANAVMGTTIINSSGQGISPRTNLLVKFGAFVRRILFTGTEATGVEYEYQGKVYTAKAATQIFVACGAYTPLLLMRSGIGNFTTLAELGYPQIYNSPGVGSNLQTHYGVQMFISTTNSSMLSSARSPSFPDYNLGISAIQFMLPIPHDFGVSARKWEVRCYSDTNLTTFNQALINAIGFDKSKTFALVGYELQPASRGTIAPSSNIKNACPLINANLFDEDADIDSIVDLWIYMYDLYVDMKTNNPSNGITLEWPPESLFSPTPDRDAIFRLAAATLIVTQDWSGACKMGYSVEQDNSVCDGIGIVHGVTNLRIADSSMYPTIPRAVGKSLTSMAIGEFIANTYIS